MKALVALLGLLTATLHSGEATVDVKTRAYNATGYIAPGQGNVPRGTRLLLICDVEGLPEGNVVTNYTWYYSFISTGRSEIQRGDPYYKAVNDTLLVDVTSWGGGTRWHICEVRYLGEDERSHKQSSFISISPTDSSTPFIATPTSLLPNHALITDVQQITGRNGQEWINCTSGSSGRGGTGVHIHSAVSGAIVAGNRMKTATIGPNSYPHNGLYYCSEGQALRYYISLFLHKNSSNLPTPIIRVLSTTAWGFSSADGSRVERYIVEFECRVRNMTFVEKYMSVSASGGTGRVATSGSCFGGLGQLYRVKVWAVSGPNISREPAVTVVNNTDGPTLTTQVPTSTPTTGTLGRVTTSSRWPAVTVVDTVHGPTPTTQVMMLTPATAGSPETPSSDTSSPTPSGTPGYSSEKARTKYEGLGIARSIIAVPLSISALMLIASIAIFTAGVVMLVRAKRVRHHSSQPPSPGTDHYEMVDEGEKRAPLGAGVYEEVDKQNTQKDGCTKHYQELDLAKMERREYASIKA